MLDDIRTFADLQAALALASEPTLVTVLDDDQDPVVSGDFVVASVEVDITGDRNVDTTTLGLVPYEEMSDAPTEQSERLLMVQQHMMTLMSSEPTVKTTLSKVTTFKKPPNG